MTAGQCMETLPTKCRTLLAPLALQVNKMLGDLAAKDTELAAAKAELARVQQEVGAPKSKL